jgi:hypothetical protein
MKRLTRTASIAALPFWYFVLMYPAPSRHPTIYTSPIFETADDCVNLHDWMVSNIKGVDTPTPGTHPAGSFADTHCIGHDDAGDGSFPPQPLVAAGWPGRGIVIHCAPRERGDGED